MTDGHLALKSRRCCAAAAGKRCEGFDPAAIRREFPILDVLVHDGKKLAYLDNAATTQKPAEVVCAMCDYYEACNANVHRSIHYLGEQATQLFEEARRHSARFLNAPSERGIVFTRGTTEGINLVAHGWGRKFIGAGDEIVLTEMEHHSNLVPWQMLAAERGAKLRFVPVLPDGTLDLAAFHAMLSERVKLVSFVHISNVLGTLNPAKEIVAAAHAVGARALVDAAQSVPHMSLDVQDLDCDFLAFSGHKMLAPTGIGVLYAREALLEQMDPFMGGGEMISRVEPDRSTWAEIPHKFEAGTPHISGAVGLGAAMTYLERVGLDNIRRYTDELAAYAIRRLEEIPGVRVFGKAPLRGSAVSFEVEGVHPHDMAQFLDREGIAIRAGHMCAQPLLRKLGVPAVNRASFYFYNLREEADRLVEAVRKTKEFFSRGTR